MLNRSHSENRFLAGVVAALTVSVLVVFATLGHAVTLVTAYA
jgi:dolichol kinase